MNNLIYAILSKKRKNRHDRKRLCGLYKAILILEMGRALALDMDRQILRGISETK